ncbi:MAG: efflux RND transporter periplasmic adaptor subunit, partial [Gammaproteobacteria bacterium]
MTRSAKHLLIVVLIVTGVVLGTAYLNRPKPVKVLVSAAEIGLVEQAIANTRAGTVKACRRSKLSPSTGGQIAKLDIHEGD